jgi:hypothetical protein
MSSSLTTFSRVDVSKLDLEEYPELKEEPPKEPENHSMGGLGGMDMGGMGGMGGFGMDNQMDDGMGMGMGGRDFDDWKTSAVTKEDVGKTFDCSGGTKHVQKKVIEAGEGYQNPREGWEVDVQYVARRADGSVLESVVDKDSGEGVCGKRCVLGGGELPEAVVTVLKTMKPGERVEVTLSKEAAHHREAVRSPIYCRPAPWLPHPGDLPLASLRCLAGAI